MIERTVSDIVGNLSGVEKAAMLSMVNGAPGWRDAISARVNGMVVTSLTRKGLTRGFSRSGDNASPLTALGIAVRDYLQAAST